MLRHSVAYRIIQVDAGRLEDVLRREIEARHEWKDQYTVNYLIDSEELPILSCDLHPDYC